MRTISHRRHLDSCAVLRQLKIASAVASAATQKELMREPHRLNKTNLTTLEDGGGASANPRRWGTSEKDRLTHSELSALRGFEAIELADLREQRAISALAGFIDTRLDPVAQSRSQLFD